MIEDWRSDLKFDVIIGIHVIEHVLDVDKVVAWTSKHLNENGILYFETPDAGSLCGRIFGNYWGMTHFPRHINLFQKSSLAKVVERNDLKVERHSNTTSAPAWNMSIRNFFGMDAISKKKSLLEIFNYSNLFTLSFFTLVDLVFLFVRLPTSTQQLIAKKTARVR